MKKTNQKLNQDQQRYAMASLWQIMCGYIVILFIRELLTEHYLIHVSIDMLVAVIAFYIALNHTLRQYHILKEYSLKKLPFIMVMVTYAAALFVAVMTIKSPFDISFVILVVGCLTGKRIFDKEISVM